MDNLDYSTQELMIIAAAREIRDHEVIFVGMRLPIMAFGVAQHSHAPNAVGLFESGLVRHEPAHDTLYTMCDPPNQLQAAWATGTLQLMGMLQGGRVDVGFIGGAEVDRFGNVNSSYIGGFDHPQVKLPGSGGAADIASQAKRLLVIVNHEKRRLVERVRYVTSPGNLDGGESRRRAGLARGGIAGLITDRAVLRPHGPEGELYLSSWHPHTTMEEVRANTGWDLKVMADAAPTVPPSEQELAVLHKIDVDGFWR